MEEREKETVRRNVYLKRPPCLPVINDRHDQVVPLAPPKEPTTREKQQSRQFCVSRLNLGKKKKKKTFFFWKEEKYLTFFPHRTVDNKKKERNA